MNHLFRLHRALSCCIAAILFTCAPALRALDAPVSPNAQPNVVQLLQFFETVRGQYIVSGQQEIAWSLTRQEEDIDYILKTTGKRPALRGFDFLQYMYSPSVRATQNATERAIAWSRSGGIVTFCNHFFVDIGSTNGTPQFYTPGTNGSSAGTNFDIREAVKTGTPENIEFLGKLDILAVELKKLRDAGVPVIWRPFHENGGTFFWWSRHGAEPFKQAWRIMFERFTQMHALNNLIWCFNPNNSTDLLQNWYPGDEMVDMISLDAYPSAGTHPSLVADYNRMRDFKAGRKIVALSETGSIPDIDAALSAGANWAYFCTWNGFENDLSRHTTQFLTTVFNHAKVLTLDELPAFYVPNAWAITLEPKTQVITAGATLTLTVAATNNPSYQWYKDGVAIAGATSATYSIAGVTTAAAGKYTAKATSAAGTLTSSAAVVTVVPSDTGRIVNLSVRADAGTDAQTLIVGFVLGDSTTPKPLLIRALGPRLGDFGVTNFLADPSLKLNTTPAILNDDWGSVSSTSPAQFNTLFSQLGATGLVSGSKDAAILMSLAGGAYSTSVLGVGGSTGAVVAEVYDTVPSSGARLVNISARSKVGGGSDLIAGFVVASDYRTVLIRAVAGATLEGFGVGGALPNAKLEVYRSINGGPSELFVTNDEWSVGETAISSFTAAFAKIGAFQLPAASHDASLLLNLGPGVYSVMVKSIDSSSGVALVEVYEVP